MNPISDKVKPYNEDNMLMISGIQHYYFCKRQWMLIHVENQWNDNMFTFKGNLIHEQVDDPFFIENRNGTKTSRSLRVQSKKLGFYGVIDLVEFYTNENIKRWSKIIPLEYKAGKPKENDCDSVQLCLEAMCWEEMMDVTIDVGHIYYHKIRRRQTIVFDKALREKVIQLSLEMHKLYESKLTISAVMTSKCKHCSLYQQCLPRAIRHSKSALKYIYQSINEGTE